MNDDGGLTKDTPEELRAWLVPGDLGIWPIPVVEYLKYADQPIALPISAWGHG